MNWLVLIAGILASLLTIVGILVGIGIVILQVILFVKAVVDRLRNKEDDYYSKNIHQ